MARRATRGGDAQFTYDFGIAIAQSTVNKVARLTGVTLSLASAFYALKTTASEYVDTLRENTLRFGGLLSTMKAMQQAQDRLITGMSRFDVRDQMAGMNQLMAAGVDVKKNMAWIEKAAHATGKSFEQFSGMIASAVQGNLQGLVNAGLMTQRATRAFAKFQGNTRMMQGAVMGFLRSHKGLMSAIKNDFDTIEDGMRRLKAVMTSFMESIIGKPNDPNSLYGSVARVFKLIADKFGKDGVLSQNMKMLRQYGEGVGIIMSWVVRKIGEVMVWLGRQAKKAMVWLLGDSETFAERMRSLVVWLEFWKLKVVDFFKEYGGAIKIVLALLVAFQALKHAFIISDMALTSIRMYGAILKGINREMSLFMALNTTAFTKAGARVASFGYLLPKVLRRGYMGTIVFLDKVIFMTKGRLAGLLKYAGVFARGLGKVLLAPFWVLLHPIQSLRYALYGVLKGLEAFFMPLLKIRFFLKKLLLVTIPRFLLQTLPIMTKSFLTAAKGALVSFGKLLVNFFLNLPTILKAAGKGLLSGLGVLWRGLKSFNLLKTLGLVISSVKTLFTSIRAGIAAIYATNPVGWIILAITLVGILYKKFRTVRIYINNMFKMEWEWLKFLWNILYGTFVYIYVGIKKAWKFLKDYVFTPVANFFKKAWQWIKEMWKGFMNTKVGRFINDWIVTPLKNLFDWMLKAWNYILKAMASVIEFIAGANSDLAKNINELAAANGLPTLAASGGNYDAKDDTDYLDPSNWGLGGLMPGNSGGNADVEEPSKNPLLSEATVSSGSNSSTTNNITLSNGAVQIIVPKGVDIDENKLARIVRDEIRNLDRENRMRGGDI